MLVLLVIVCDLNFVCVSTLPAKADPPLIIDPYAVLTSAIPGELLQPVARWSAEIHQGLSRVQDVQLPLRQPLKFQVELPRALTTEHRLGMPVTK